jgi:hypothetical protein
MFFHRNGRCGGGSRQAGLLGDQSEDLFECRIGGGRLGTVPGDPYGQSVEGLTVARLGRTGRQRLAIPASVFRSIGPHGGWLSHARGAGTGAAHSRLAAQALNLPGEKTRPHAPPSDYLAESRAKLPCCQRETTSGPVQKDTVLRNILGFERARGTRGGKPRSQHFSPTAPIPCPERPAASRLWKTGIGHDRGRRIGAGPFRSP